MQNSLHLTNGITRLLVLSAFAITDTSVQGGYCTDPGPMREIKTQLDLKVSDKQALQGKD